MQPDDLGAELAKHHAAAFGWALACCRWDRIEAEELLQTVYLKILDGRARFSGRSAFRTWLFGVVRRTASERRRRTRIRTSAFARWWVGEPDAQSESPQVRLEHSQQSAALVAALAQLPRRQREVLHLVFYAELTLREAAEAMGVGIGSARTHYARGKRRLRDRLGHGS